MTWIIDHAPPGCRFLMQCVGAITEQECMTLVKRICGVDEKRVTLVRGVYRIPNDYKKLGWTFDKDGGWIAFAPPGHGWGNGINSGN